MTILNGRIAMVTGAGQGLGRAVAKEFSAEGATVALLEKNPDTLAAVKAEIEDAGSNCEDYEVDITDYDSYGDVIVDLIDKHRRIDVLVNNAAIQS